MNLVPYAVPFFVLAMLVELGYGLWRKRNTYRVNDAVGSLFLGVLSQMRRFVVLGVGGLVYAFVADYLALWQMDASHWATWVIAFVGYDFCYYWLHRMGHERSILWAAHVAHHQSEDYNLSTALRQTSSGFLLSWIFYLPLFFMGVPAEVFVTVGSLNLIYQFWVHTEHVPKLGWYEWIFVTPSNHRVHHAQNDVYLDRNYGGVFILWDRLFGSFQDELDEEPCVYGIRGPLRTFNPVPALTHIYVDMFKDCWRTKSWRDKFRVWIARTGWQPEDVEKTHPRNKNDLSTFRKYDPPTSKTVAWYALFQLIAVVLLGNWMEATDTLTYGTGALLVACTVLSMVTTAGWMEHVQSSRQFVLETVRLTLLAGCLGVWWYQNALPSEMLAALAAYGVLNVIWLAVFSLRAPREHYASP